MIKTLILTLFILLFNPLSFGKGLKPSCTIISYGQIYYLAKAKPPFLKRAIKKSTCSQRINLNFLNFIVNSKGTFNERQFNEHLSKQLPIAILLKPKKIKVKTLTDYLTQNLSKERDSKWENIKIVGTNKLITLNRGEELKLKCNNCSQGGIKNVLFISFNESGDKKGKFWVTGNLLFKTTVLSAKNDYQVNHNNLDKFQFQKKEKYVQSPENYFIDTKVIKFYKLNKHLSKNKSLKFNDLTPLYLVRSGSAAKIIFKSKHFKVETMGLPLRNGKIGEMIQLRNLKSKKIILGKVIGFNKVMTNL